MKLTNIPRVKICCIQSIEEAWLAIKYSASALGLVSEMPSGPGPISEQLIKEIAAIIPPGITSVLLTSKTDTQQIIEQQRRCGVNAIQIVDRLEKGSYHDFREAIPGISIIQVIHVSGEESIEEAISVAPHVDAIWIASEKAKFASGYPSSQPHITHDNKRLYFGWHRPVPQGETSYMGDREVWISVKTENGWSEPKYAGQGMFVSSSNDGQIYTNDMSTRMIDGRTYLTKVRIENERFVVFERLRIEPQFEEGPAHPCIAPDGSFILFDMAGGNHLFVSFKRKDGTWGKAIDLTKHGFDQMAGGSTITPDGKYLFFHLNSDLWWVDIKIIEELRMNN